MDLDAADVLAQAVYEFGKVKVRQVTGKASKKLRGSEVSPP